MACFPKGGRYRLQADVHATSDMRLLPKVSVRNFIKRKAAIEAGKHRVC